MEQYSKYSDEELIQRLRAGETGIADYLIEKYKYLVRRKAGVLCKGFYGAGDDIKCG